MAGRPGADKTPWVSGRAICVHQPDVPEAEGTACMPYYYSYATSRHYDTGVPMVRALDAGISRRMRLLWGNQTQYEYHVGREPAGRSGLSGYAGWMNNGNEVRNKIYLPGGEDQVWIDYFTGEQYTGRTRSSTASTRRCGSLPLFVKSGAILPDDRGEQFTAVPGTGR